ncbi:hypothetical protein K0M31_001050, partial [Melipona bicolor]
GGKQEEGGESVRMRFRREGWIGRCREKRNSKGEVRPPGVLKGSAGGLREGIGIQLE